MHTRSRVLGSANGIYIRDGNFRGLPRYKQATNASNPFYIRQGGSSNSGYGIHFGAESAPGAWAYFCEASRNQKSIQQVPQDTWVCHGNCGAVDPAPKVVRRNIAYQVKGAGLEAVNGVYMRDGDFRGSPRYKQANASNPFYIRQGGSVNSGYGLHYGAESAPGAWAYFCEASRNKQGIQQVPQDNWVCHGNHGAKDPVPTVITLDAYEVRDSGLAATNGLYIRDGDFRGSPRYKQDNASKPFYIRQGGSANSGYGIHYGAESAPGAWAYFCEASRNKQGIQQVPQDNWVCHGSHGAKDPPPMVVRF